jgi:hypothetical protein
MDRKPLNTHFHIHWTKKEILDWEPFRTHTEALARAEELSGTDELFTIAEVSVKCPVCGAKAASAS